MPAALMARRASGRRRSASAPARPRGFFDVGLMPAENSVISCSSGGNGPTSSIARDRQQLADLLHRELGLAPGDQLGDDAARSGCAISPSRRRRCRGVPPSSRNGSRCRRPSCRRPTRRRGSCAGTPRRCRCRASPRRRAPRRPMPERAMSARVPASILPLRDQLVDDRARENRDVETLAGLDLLVQQRRDVDLERQDVAGPPLEVRADRPHDRAGAVRAQDLELGGRRAAERRKQGGEDRRQHSPVHDALLLAWRRPRP